MAQPTCRRLVWKQREAGRATVVQLCGSAGIDEAEKLQESLERLAAKEVPLIVLDLSEMDFICSQGLGAIITGYLKCRHHNGEIRLVNPQPAVHQLLETTRLTKLFPIFATVEQAIGE